MIPIAQRLNLALTCFLQRCDRVERFFKCREGLRWFIQVGVTLGVGVAAWIGVQGQIKNQQGILERQQIEARKERRLTYLRTYVPELENFSLWMFDFYPKVTFLLGPFRAYVNGNDQIVRLYLKQQMPLLEEVRDGLNKMPKLSYLPGGVSVEMKKSFGLTALSRLEQATREATGFEGQGATITNEFARDKLGAAYRDAFRSLNWDLVHDWLQVELSNRQYERSQLEEQLEYRIEGPLPAPKWVN